MKTTRKIPFESKYMRMRIKKNRLEALQLIRDSKRKVLRKLLVTIEKIVSGEDGRHEKKNWVTREMLDLMKVK